MASTTQPADLYAYEPLEKGHIRVLRLASTDGQITGRLKSVALKAILKRQKYYALSYTWGSSLTTHPFECDGQNLPVRTNLRDALPILQGFAEPLWVDAICINQANDKEKVWQIQLMSTIYKSAGKVLIWLGPATSDTDYTLSHQTELLALLKKLKRPTDANSVDARFIRGLGSLLTRDWWSRLWTLQEAALAPSVIFLCGIHRITWPNMKAIVQHVVRLDLRNACRGTAQKPEFCDGFNEVGNIESVSKIRSVNIVPNLLRVARQRNCYDPRDRIYGILGLLPAMYQEWVSFDADDTAEDVYMFFAGAMLNQIDVEGVILSLNETGVRREGLPSWCPDFHQRPIADLLCDYPGYHAGFSTQGSAKFEFDPVKRTLLTNGLVIDEAAELISGSWSTMIVPPIKQDGLCSGSPARAQGHHPSAVRATVPLSPITANIAWLRAVEAAASRPEYLWETLIGAQIVNDENDKLNYLSGLGKLFDKIEKHRFSDERSSLKASYTSLLPALLRAEASHGFNAFPPDLMAYIHKLERVCLNRKFITTKAGRFGLAPVTTQPGDLIVVLKNVNIPFILRRAGHGQDIFTLIGETYIHGLMHGECLKDGRSFQKIMLM